MAKKPRHQPDDMLVSNESFVTDAGQAFIKNVTRVRGDHPIVKKHPHLFKALDVSYPTLETATAAPAEKRGGDLTAARAALAAKKAAAAESTPATEPEAATAPADEPEQPETESAAGGLTLDSISKE